MLIYMIKWTSEGSTWLPESYAGIWTPGLRYNLKIYFAIKIPFKLYIKYYNMHYNKYKLRIYCT